MKTFVPVLVIITELFWTINGQCLPNPNVTPGPGDPPFPNLPDAFSTKIEANLKDIGKSITASEYYDYGKKIATLIATDGGETKTQIFDYNNDQEINIEKNVCEVLNLSLSSDTVMFGTAQSPGGIPHIFTTNGILHFMKKNGQVYKGPSYVRGINTDHWSTCLNWKTLNSTFTLDYFFSTSNWKTPIDFPQIPVRAIATGVQILPNGTSHQFEHYYEYIDFRVDLDDYTVFEIPRGVYCRGLKMTKPVPKVTKAFHFEMELIIPQSPDITGFNIWYDSDLQLLRGDYRLLKPIYPAYTTNPLSEVHDYTTGIRYVTDMVNKNCTILAIANSTFDADNGPLGEHLKNSTRFMFLDANYTYTGVRNARGVPCDVFTARHVYPFNGKMYNATLDYYFLSDSFKEYPSDGSTSPKDVPFRYEATLTVPDMPDIVIINNFLNYDTEKRSLRDFDISACYKKMKSLRFKLHFPGAMRHADEGVFLLKAQRMLPIIMNISSIRLQDTRVDYEPSSVVLTGTIIDIAPDYAKFYQAITVNRPSTYSTTGFIAQRSFDGTGKWQDCATYCVQSFDFICNSFDYCPNGKCHLYHDRRTNITSYLKSNISPCLNYTVYQRTIVGVSNQETAVADAYGNLQDAIKQNNIYLQAYDQYGFDTDYYAIEAEIIAGVLEYDEMPMISGQFSYRQEVTFPNVKQVYGSDVWYDYNFRIARYDVVDHGAPFYSNSPLKHIQDYNTGVQYVIDTERQNCTAIPISSTFFARTHNKTYKMGNPLEIFHLNGNYKFIGQQTIRGLTCNLFEAVINNFKLDPNDPMTYDTTFRYYFLKDDWTEKSDTNDQTSSAQPIRLDMSSAAKGFFITYNYFNWNNEDPDLNNFNTVPCFPGDQQKHFVIVFSGNYYPNLMAKAKYFKLMVHNKLAQLANVSVTRFQQPQLEIGLSNIYVIMTAVDQAPQFDGVPYHPEPDIDTVFQTLNNNIYRGLLTISIPLNNGSVYVYSAISIDDNVLRNDGKPLSSKTLSHFKSMKDKAMKTLGGKLAGVSVDDCAEACLSELTFDCESFDYCYNSGWCGLSNTYAQSNTNLIYDRPKCDLYYRSYLDKFTALPGQLPNVPSTQNSITATAEACAQKCINSKTCRSFVYCLMSQTCSMLQKRHLDIPKNTNNTNAMCTFYSRSYLNDFKYSARSTVSFTSQVLSVAAVSVDDCAKLCSQTGSMTCNSFSFCGNDTTCRLTPSHPVTGLKVVATDYCDLYTRTYYSSPAKLTQTTPKSAGYSSGTLAGVAIGVLILGIIFGGVLIIVLSKKRKLPKMEIFNMTYQDPHE